MNKLAVDIGTSFFGQSTSQLTETTVLGQLASIVVEVFLAVGGIMVVFFIIMAGFGYISSAGNDDPKGAAASKQAATNAVIGFIIMFTAYWIIQILEILTGINVTSLG